MVVSFSLESLESLYSDVLENGFGRNYHLVFFLKVWIDLKNQVFINAKFMSLMLKLPMPES